MPSLPLPFLVLAALGALACGDRKPDQVAAATTLPAAMHPIGPQPGPDRDLALRQNPYAGNHDVLAEGRRLFVWMNCAGCHGDHGGGGMGPSLRDSTWIYGGADDDIFASIMEGRANGMPAWGTKIPEDQVWRLVSYIKSFRTSYEPDQPR